MEPIDWLQCPEASSSSFPVLWHRGELVGLDAPQVDAPLSYRLKSRKHLAQLLKDMDERACDPLVCVRVAKCLVAIYLSASSKDTVSSLLAQTQLPLPSVAVYAGAKQIKEALDNYAKAIDTSAYIYVEAANARDYETIGKCMRHSTHALYGLHACLNAYLIAAGVLPIVASAYVVVKPKLAIGPIRLNSFFLGPDGQADPETIVMLPATSEFIRPFDQWISEFLRTLCGLGTAQSIETLDPTSPLNRHLRKQRDAPATMPKRE